MVRRSVRTDVTCRLWFADPQPRLISACCLCVLNIWVDALTALENVNEERCLLLTSEMSSFPPLKVGFNATEITPYSTISMRMCAISVSPYLLMREKLIF